MAIVSMFPSKKYTKIKEFADEYFSQLNRLLRKIDSKELDRITKVLKNTIKQKKTLFVCGNGGSAAIANHFLCDYAKYVATNTNIKPRIISLSSNIEILTAIANDIGYNKSFSYQLDNLGNPGDVLLVISSSGNSPNIINTIKLAKKKKIKTIALTGFKGGHAHKLTDYKLNFGISNYGISEDSHHILMHVVCQFIRLSEMSKKTIQKSKF